MFVMRFHVEKGTVCLIQSHILRNSRKECGALVLRDFNGGSKSSMVKVIILHHAVENSKPCAKGYLLLHSDE